MSKRGNKTACLCSYYFSVVKNNKSNSKGLDFLFKMEEKLIKLAFTLLILLLITIVFYSINDTLFNSYLTSEKALRLLKLLAESSLTVVLGILGLIALFSAFDKQYYIFFSANDVFRMCKIKETTLSIVINFVFSIIGSIIYYIVFYIIPINNYSSLLLINSFVISIISSLCLAKNTYKMITTILKLIFNEKFEFTILEQMHKTIHFAKKIKNRNLKIENKNEIEDNIDYLLYKFSAAKMGEINNEIMFFSFLKSFTYLPLSMKIKCYLLSYFELSFISSLIYCLIRYEKFISFEYNNITSIFIIAILNMLICLLIYHKPGIRDVFVFLNFGAFGFKIITQKNISYCVAQENSHIRSQFNRYFVCLYNIISLFRNVLETNKEVTDFFYDKLINSEEADCLLCSICTFFYYNQYKKDTKKLLSEFKQYLQNNETSFESIKNNTINVLVDISRDFNIIYLAENFFSDVENCKIGQI